MAISSSDPDDIVADINVTPLVDVCLVLVIIFMVTAPLMTESELKVELPAAHTKEGAEQDKVTITLAADGRVALDRMEFKTLEALREDLRIRLAMSQSGLVVIRADKDALHGKLTEIMAVAKGEGARGITIATKQR